MFRLSVSNEPADKSRSEDENGDHEYLSIVTMELNLKCNIYKESDRFGLKGFRAVVGLPVQQL